MFRYDLSLVGPIGIAVMLLLSFVSLFYSFTITLEKIKVPAGHAAMENQQGKTTIEAAIQGRRIRKA